MHNWSPGRLFACLYINMHDTLFQRTDWCHFNWPSYTFLSKWWQYQRRGNQKLFVCNPIFIMLFSETFGKFASLVTTLTDKKKLKMLSDEIILVISADICNYQQQTKDLDDSEIKNPPFFKWSFFPLLFPLSKYFFSYFEKKIKMFSAMPMSYRKMIKSIQAYFKTSANT